MRVEERNKLEGTDYCVDCEFLAGDYCTAYQKDTVDVDEVDTDLNKNVTMYESDKIKWRIQ